MYELIIAPDPIYKTICTPVVAVTDTIRTKLDHMMETLREHDAMGIGAPMVGLTERLVVVELTDETGKRHSFKMVNPYISKKSEETSTMEEASITFLGVSAPITRPREVTVTYLDEQGVEKHVEATGILSVCLQHELDYLDGKTILDYQSPMKRDIMTRKMEKQKRIGRIPHVHGPNCSHG